MAEPQNTIDLIGDDAFTDMILARSVPSGGPTDWYDEVVRSLRPYALYGMQGVEIINFPNVTKLEGCCFTNAKGLKRVELANCTTMAGSNFQECTSLEEVVAPKLSSIGLYEFGWSRNIHTVDFPYLLSTGDGTWYGATELTSCNLPRLKNLAYATFLSTPKLMQIDLPSIETIQNTVISGAPEEGEDPRIMNLGPNLNYIHACAFINAPEGMVINMVQAEGEIEGAPWSGSDIVINYNVPYSGTVPMST